MGRYLDDICAVGNKGRELGWFSSSIYMLQTIARAIAHVADAIDEGHKMKATSELLVKYGIDWEPSKTKPPNRLGRFKIRAVNRPCPSSCKNGHWWIKVTHEEMLELLGSHLAVEDSNFCWSMSASSLCASTKGKPVAWLN